MGIERVFEVRRPETEALDCAKVGAAAGSFLKLFRIKGRLRHKSSISEMGMSL